MTSVKSLIINSSYERPVGHWRDDQGIESLKIIPLEV